MVFQGTQNFTTDPPYLTFQHGYSYSHEIMTTDLWMETMCVLFSDECDEFKQLSNRYIEVSVTVGLGT